MFHSWHTVWVMSRLADVSFVAYGTGENSLHPLYLLLEIRTVSNSADIIISELLKVVLPASILI
jgi:hypothetical protein